MTWNTPSGDRFVVAEEAVMLRASINQMVDQVREDHLLGLLQSWEYGVSLFDSLPGHGRLALLHVIAKNLFQPTHPSLELTAINEAAAYAVYRNVIQQVEIEIDSDVYPGFQPRCPSTYWRGLVSDAYLQRFEDPLADDPSLEPTDDEDDFGLPSLDCDDVDRWEFIVDALADEVLWDRDFEMGDLIMDVDPDRAAAMKHQLGIEDDYFTAIPEDPGEDHTTSLEKSIREIVRPF